MKPAHILLLTLGLSIAAASQADIHAQKDELTGPYLGQTPPNLTPEVFAPNIISTNGWEYGVVFAPNLQEMYFVRENTDNAPPQQEFVVYESKDNTWKARVVSQRVGTPTLSPDNKIMFFGRSFKMRTDNGWSEMQRLGDDFEAIRIMRVTASFQGTIAFDEATADGKGLLRFSTLENGKYSPPQQFPKHINTGNWNAHPFIAPDESYVIWDGQRGADSRNSDLYISFKQHDGSWGEAIKFGEDINSPASEFAAQVSPDGKYLFFNRNVDQDNVDTFWVDARVIDNLKPSHIQQQTKQKAPNATPAMAAGPFRDIPTLEKAYISTRPNSSDKALASKHLSLGKEKEDRLIEFVQQMGEGKFGRYDSMLISHKNALVFESYFKRGRYELAHPQASATKGYTSLIVGRAIELGYLSLDDLHKPIVSFFTEIDTSKLVEGAHKVTLHKMLTMHGGLGINEETWKALEETPERLQGHLLVEALLANSAPITDTTQVYKYGNYNPILVMAVVDAVVPNGAQAFIKNEVLDKLNISNYRWQNHISGLPQAGWMVSFTSRDMLKLGNIVAHKGKWQGKPFVSESYLKTATSGLVKPTEDWIPEEFGYGYFWYTAPVRVDANTYDASFAWGGGGQRVVVVDDLKLVIAITGHDRDDLIMEHITDIVIPAFVE